MHRSCCFFIELKYSRMSAHCTALVFEAAVAYIVDCAVRIFRILFGGDHRRFGRADDVQIGVIDIGRLGRVCRIGGFGEEEASAVQGAVKLRRRGVPNRPPVCWLKSNAER